MTLLFTLLAWVSVAPAQILRDRLATPACQSLMTTAASESDSLEMAYWARHQSTAVFDGPGEVHVMVDPVANADQTFGLLDALAKSSPSPFAKVHVPYTNWQMGIWPMSNENGTREAWIIADRLVYDHDRLKVTEGEFVVEIHYDEVIGYPVVEGIAELAHARTGLPRAKLKGLRSFEGAYRGTIFLFLDLVGSAEFRYHQTLRLMKFINEEFGELNLP